MITVPRTDPSRPLAVVLSVDTFWTLTVRPGTDAEAFRRIVLVGKNSLESNGCKVILTPNPQCSAMLRMRVNLYAEVDPEIVSLATTGSTKANALKHSQTFAQAVIAALREMHTVGTESGAYVKLLVAKRVPIPMVNTWAEDEAPTRRRS